MFTAEFPTSGEKVAVKKFIGHEHTDERILIKEAKLLNSLQHKNIVGFKGVCIDQYALLLEFVQFDFNPFGIDLKVNSLAVRLRQFDKTDCANIAVKVFMRAAEDVALGLQYLHQKGLAHRDLKPSNVLVSNQHYCHLTSQEYIEKVSFTTPLICKLTDFGESRSREFQTNTILTTKTSRINRGTPGFMAPEVLVKGLRTQEFSVEDLKKVDVWAYGMIVFCIISPGLAHPFALNLLEDATSTNHLECLEKLVKSKKRPKPQEKYTSKHTGEWIELWKVYQMCAEFKPSERPRIDDVVTTFQNVTEESCALATEESCALATEESCALATEESCALAPATVSEFHLKVCQTSFAEECNRVAATRIQEGSSISKKEMDELYQSLLIGDATNSCVFLCLKIADRILSDTTVLSWNDLVRISESVIRTLPKVINEFRDISPRYDVLEAYSLMKSNNCISSLYQFTEEIPYPFGVFTQEGKEKLLDAVKTIRNSDTCFALYTCEPYSFLLGSLMDSAFILDIHAVPSACGGRSTGILMCFSGSVENSIKCASKWLWERLLSSGVKGDTPQSLCVMR